MLFITQKVYHRCVLLSRGTPPFFAMLARRMDGTEIRGSFEKEKFCQLRNFFSYRSSNKITDDMRDTVEPEFEGGSV